MDSGSKRRHLPVILSRTGDSPPVETKVKPLKSGRCRLEIVISLSRELDLLQTLLVEIDVIEQTTAKPVEVTIE